MKKIRYIRGSIALLAGILFVLAFAGQFYPLKIFDLQLVALVQRVVTDFSLTAVILLCGLLLLTLFLGRIYCSTLCPLGLLQEGLMMLFRRRGSYHADKPYKYFIAAIVWGSLVGGTVWLMRLIDPYSLFGSAAGGAVFGLLILALLVVLVWFRGRLFCSDICPVGAVLGLLSRYAVNRIYIERNSCVSCGACASKCPTGSIDYKSGTVNNETCIKCFRCFASCHKSALQYGAKKAEDVVFCPGRRKFLVGGAAALFLLSVKGGISLGKAVGAKIKQVILPPGAKNAEVFANRCLNCNLCVVSCPMKIIKKADGDYPAVHLDYEDAFCDYDCHKCSQVCPSGDIERLSLDEKRKTQIGLAVIDDAVCVKCGLCVMKCPREAIRKEEGEFPQINADECIGCGTCQVVCPVKAVTIRAVDKQRIL